MPSLEIGRSMLGGLNRNHRPMQSFYGFLWFYLDGQLDTDADSWVMALPTEVPIGGSPGTIRRPITIQLRRQMIDIGYRQVWLPGPAPLIQRTVLHFAVGFSDEARVIVWQYLERDHFVAWDFAHAKGGAGA